MPFPLTRMLLVTSIGWEPWLLTVMVRIQPGETPSGAGPKSRLDGFTLMGDKGVGPGAGAGCPGGAVALPVSATAWMTSSVLPRTSMLENLEPGDWGWK